MLPSSNELMKKSYRLKLNPDLPLKQLIFGNSTLDLSVRHEALTFSPQVLTSKLLWEHLQRLHSLRSSHTKPWPDHLWPLLSERASTTHWAFLCPLELCTGGNAKQSVLRATEQESVTIKPTEQTPKAVSMTCTQLGKTEPPNTMPRLHHILPQLGHF